MHLLHGVAARPEQRLKRITEDEVVGGEVLPGLASGAHVVVEVAEHQRDGADGGEAGFGLGEVEQNTPVVVGKGGRDEAQGQHGEEQDGEAKQRASPGEKGA